MIYLIAQMLVVLILAAVFGAAIGWLVHRASHSRQLQDYKRALAKSRNQAAQIESEVAMLSDDYDELQRRSKVEINALRSENQQIPFLNTNLEKSQLLVRQMMQRHEAKVRDLSSENQALSAKLKSIKDREQAYNKVKVELDSIRRQRLTEVTASRPISETNDATEEHAASSKVAVSIEEDDTNQLDTAQLSESQLDLDATDDEALELLDATIVSSPAEALINNLNARTNLNEEKPASSSWASAPIEISADRSASDDTLEEYLLDESMDDSMADELDLSAELDEDDAILARRRVAASAEIAAASDGNDDPFDEVMEFGDELQHELDISSAQNALDDPLLDGSSDSASLFEPVEQRDDLKQIFGIGPVTEKALNKLGITSYSQLAELKSHEIEKIAGALEIVPGRIERDDWVGNARRQLEEVLEEL